AKTSTIAWLGPARPLENSLNTPDGKSVSLRQVEKMSLSDRNFRRTMSGATESLHRAHIADLRSALAAGGKQLPTEVVEQCERMLGALENRLDLGVDHTIVALAGGTGSGKSSTFNALSGLEFADVGVKRPTTARVNAC